jgi:hypothetical protein
LDWVIQPVFLQGFCQRSVLRRGALGEQLELPRVRLQRGELQLHNGGQLDVFHVGSLRGEEGILPLLVLSLSRTLHGFGSLV